MCIYSVKIDDAVMRRARPHFKGADAMQLWIERQLQKALIDYASQFEKRGTKVENALSELSNLEEDWDGYGAPAISRKAINNCRNVTSSYQEKDMSVVYDDETYVRWIYRPHYINDNGVLKSCFI